MKKIFDQINKYLSSKKAVKNAVVLSFSEVFIRAAKFILLIVAARELGPVNFGLFNYVLAAAALVAIIGDFGINKIITRNVAKDPDKLVHYAGSLVVQSIVLVILGLVGVLIMAMTEGATAGWLFLLLAGFTAFNVLGDYVWSFFRALELMDLEARAKSVQALVVLVAGLALLYSPYPLLGLGVAYVVGSVTTLVIAIKGLGANFKVNLVPNLDTWIELIKQSWPIALVAVSAFVFNQIDSIMLGAMGMLEGVGLYNAAYKIISGLLIPVFIFNQVLYPRFARLEFKSSTKLVRHNAALNLGIYSIIGLLIWKYGARILEVVYGATYAPAAYAFFILALALLVTAVVTPFSSWAIARDYLMLNLLLSVLAAIINIALNFILIPDFGYSGAAMATLITYMFLLLGYVGSIYILARRKTATVL